MEHTQEKEISLEEFVEKLIEEKGMADLDSETLKQVKADLLSRVEDRVNAAIIEHLPKEKFEEFEKLLDSDSTDEKAIQEFTSSSIPNLPSIIASELLQFKNSYLS